MLGLKEKSRSLIATAIIITAAATNAKAQELGYYAYPPTVEAWGDSSTPEKLSVKFCSLNSGFSGAYTLTCPDDWNGKIRITAANGSSVRVKRVVLYGSNLEMSMSGDFEKNETVTLHIDKGVVVKNTQTAGGAAITEESPAIDLTYRYVNGPAMTYQAFDKYGFGDYEVKGNLSNITISDGNSIVARATGLNNGNLTFSSVLEDRGIYKMVIPENMYITHYELGDENKPVYNERIEMYLSVGGNPFDVIRTLPAQGSTIGGFKKLMLIFPDDVAEVVYKGSNKITLTNNDTNKTYQVGGSYEKTFANALDISFAEEITEPGRYTLRVPEGTFKSYGWSKFANESFSVDFTIAPSAGVESVEADDDSNSATSYFGIDGTKLDRAPSHGIFIEKRGGKARKILR
ncbi:MAG: hypothetical protein NC210_07250 [[Clostridium] fimetarium]|nr:hypothetical protein [Alistipes timonensis]MCM1406201.1 hypothetical protein [[Clostridium] fimetarium]